MLEPATLRLHGPRQDDCNPNNSLALPLAAAAPNALEVNWRSAQAADQSAGRMYDVVTHIPIIVNI